MGQQTYLQYILEEKFHAIYFQWGVNLYLTLGLANIDKVHVQVKYITVEQLENDINYLYYALNTLSEEEGVIWCNRNNTQRISLPCTRTLLKNIDLGDRETYIYKSNLKRSLFIN